MEQITLEYKKNKIHISAKKVSAFRKISGLMFRTLSTQNLLFVFSKDTCIPFHSWLVFFPFLMLWLDEKNKVLEWRVVRPFSSAIVPRKIFRKAIEIPIHPRNDKIIKIFVDKGKI